MTRSLALAILVGGAIAGASASSALGDSDMYWHLANAKQMAERGLVRSDIYSWTAFGAAVPTDQWLGDAILGAGYTVFGWTGVTAARTIAVAVLVAAIALAAFLRRSRSPVVALGVALPAIVLSRYLWIERPELFGVACLAVLVVLLQLPGERPLIATAPLLIVWANLHGSFALGSVLVLLISAGGSMREPGLRRGYVLAATAAILAFVATPAGLGTIATPSAHLLSPPRDIQEWAPPDITTPPGALWALVLILTLGTASITGGARMRDVLLIAPVAMLSLVAIRHAPLFAIVATPYLAERLPIAVTHVWSLADAGGSSRREGVEPRSGEPLIGGVQDVPIARRPERRVDPPAAGANVAAGGRAAGTAATSIAGIALMLAGIAIAPREPDESAYPTGALASLPAGPGLLAEYDWGGWLIWHAPSTPVFVDGRLSLYRDPVLGDYVRVLQAAPGWREVLDRRGVRTLFVRPTDPVAVRAAELGWPIVSRSPSYVLISVVHR